jgi:hypothetical protein
MTQLTIVVFLYHHPEGPDYWPKYDSERIISKNTYKIEVQLLVVYTFYRFNIMFAQNICLNCTSCKSHE